MESIFSVHPFIPSSLPSSLLGTFISIGMASALRCIGFFYEHWFPHFIYQLDLKKNLWKKVLNRVM